MIIRINGVEVSSLAVEKVGATTEYPTLRPAVLRVIDRALAKLDDNKWRMLVTTCALILTPKLALAAGSAAGGWKIIHLLQKGAFWVGLAVSIWGVYEWQVGGPGWKDRILKGFLGYVLVMILPMLFLTIQEAFGE